MFPDIFIILCRKAKTQPDSSRSQQVWAPDSSVHIFKQVRILFFIQNISPLTISSNPPPCYKFFITQLASALIEKKASISTGYKKRRQTRRLGDEVALAQFFSENKNSGG